MKKGRQEAIYCEQSRILSVSFIEAMDIEPTIINKAVREILDKMVRELPHYRWESLCTYSDGKGTTIIELNIYRAGGSERLGRIAYHLETGEVVNLRYRDFKGDAPESIVDLILDVVNIERQRVAG